MKYDYDRNVTSADVFESVKYMMEVAGFAKALEIPDLLGEDFALAVLAYRDQANGKKLNLRPELRKVVDHLTELLVERSRKQDTHDTRDAQEALPTYEAQVAEDLAPLVDVLAGLGVPEDALAKAVKLTAVVTETLVDLVGDEELAVEVYDQLDPDFAPFAVLAYRKQAEGYEFAPGELEPEVRKELDRFTEILVELSRREDRELVEPKTRLNRVIDGIFGDDSGEESDVITLPFEALPREAEERIERLIKSLSKAFGGEDTEEPVEPIDPIDHYEDYRVNAKHWDAEDGEVYDKTAHQRLQEDILRAARKNGGFVLATRQIWAKPVAKTDDGRWVFETEYGLEYLDFEDYEFEPEFADDFDSIETTLNSLLSEADSNCYRRDFETKFKYLNHTITHNPYDNRFLVILVVEETTYRDTEYWDE